MGDSFRDAAWDNQLDTMLDDLQASVQAGGSETHGYKNGYHSANGGELGSSYIIYKYLHILSIRFVPFLSEVANFKIIILKYISMNLLNFVSYSAEFILNFPSKTPQLFQFLMDFGGVMAI